MSLRATLVFAALLAVVAGIGVGYVNKKHFPKNCLTLPDPPAGATYTKPDPLSLPYCGFDTEPTFEGQARPARSDFRASCDRGEVPVDIAMVVYGNLQWACTNDPQRVADYYRRYAGIISGRDNPNKVAASVIEFPSRIIIRNTHRKVK